MSNTIDWAALYPEIDMTKAIAALEQLPVVELKHIVELGIHLDQLVVDFRARNSDVFLEPDALRAAMFTIEEITEALNANEALMGAGFLRSTERMTTISKSDHTELAIKLMIEVGQALFMLVSMAHAMGIADVASTLPFALAKMEQRCLAKRGMA